MPLVLTLVRFCHPCFHSLTKYESVFAAQDALKEERLAILASSKLAFVVRLLKDLKANGNRTLVFSQSTRVLELIQNCLSLVGVKILRIDGSTPVHDRIAAIALFNTQRNSADAFLLTTGAGGVGITLTGADRVIIYDPSWNPATDAQAVDRAFRVGQERDVVVRAIPYF